MIDAYESLKLAAERPGAPLCGQRVFIKNGDQLTVERRRNDPTSDQVIGTWDRGVPTMYVEHGGRVISNYGLSNAGLDHFVWSPSGWVRQTGPGGGPTSSGFLAAQLGKHDGDTLLYGEGAGGASPTQFRLWYADTLYNQIGPASPWIPVVPGRESGWAVDPDPATHLAYGCCRVAGVIDTLNLSTGQLGSFPSAVLPGTLIDAIGLAEDGTELRVLSREPAVACHLSFVSLRPADRGQLLRAISIPVVHAQRCPID